MGAQAEDWDLQSGTARAVATPYGWKSLRYSGPDPSYGYLVLWTDSGSMVRLERRTADGDLRTEYDTALASTAGSPRHPGVLVSADGSTALLSSRDGPLQLLDLGTDTIAGPGPFVQAPSCEPLARWSRTEAVVGCGSSIQVNTFDTLVGRPILVTPSGSEPDARRRGVADRRLARRPAGRPLLDVAGHRQSGRPRHPITLSGVGAGLVPNAVVGTTVYLGGTRCATDGDRLVAYDLRSGGATELAGPRAGRPNGPPGRRHHDAPVSATMAP